MSWEALRLTSRTPSEVYHVMGPNGVDGLIREALQRCWSALPSETRSFDAWKELARSVFNRNIAVWARIKKPSPQNFFEDLRSDPADGFIRQAMVLCWMMTPMGKRVFPNVKKVVLHIFERNMSAWKEDNDTFTSNIKRKPPTFRKQLPATKAVVKKMPAKKPAAKKTKRRK